MDVGDHPAIRSWREAQEKEAVEEAKDMEEDHSEIDSSGKPNLKMESKSITPDHLDLAKIYQIWEQQFSPTLCRVAQNLGKLVSPCTSLYYEYMNHSRNPCHLLLLPIPSMRAGV